MIGCHQGKLTFAGNRAGWVEMAPAKIANSISGTDELDLRVIDFLSRTLESFEPAYLEKLRAAVAIVSSGTSE